MDHASEGEIPEEDRVLPSHHRRVTFRSDTGNDENCNGNDGIKTEARHTASDDDMNGNKQESSELGGDESQRKLCDVERKKSPEKIVGILRPRSISLSPVDFQASSSTEPRFKLSKLSKAMRRSEETRDCIERLKKQIFQRLQHQHLNPKSSVVGSSLSQSKDSIESSENQPLSLVQKERRMLCMRSTKALMKQSLPPSMLPFVEDALKAVHFLRRRRKENGHGRIIHQILVEQHKQVLKELEQIEDRNGEQVILSGSSHRKPSR